MYEYSFLAYIDIDEFIVPSANIPLVSYIEYLSKKHKETASFKFNGFVFCDMVTGQSSKGGNYIRKTDSFLYLLHKPLTLKSIVIPKYVLDSHVHSVKYSTEGITKSITIDTNEAKLYHFRKGHTCDNVTNTSLDNTFQRYRIHLSNVMNEVMKNII